MTPPRVLALCVFRDGDRVALGPSGEVESGEYGVQAVARLTGGAAAQVQALGTLENVGPAGHEVVLVYAARSSSPGALAWKTLDELRQGPEPARPDGLLELLAPMPYSALPAYQQRVADFVDAAGLRAGVEARTLDLVSEVGEVAKEVLKGSRYGDAPFDPPPTWPGELADAFFSLACLANATNVDLDRALDGALAKYRDRLMKRGDAGSGR